MGIGGGPTAVHSLAAFVPCRRPRSPTPVVVLYVVSTLLGGIIYLYFRVDVRPELERAGHWHVLGFFDLKEHFAAIGLALLPAYWVCWRRPHADEPAQTRTALTSILAFIVWWSFLTGHFANNIMGFGS